MPRPPAPQLLLGPMGHSGVPGESEQWPGWHVGEQDCDIGWLVILTSESLGAWAPSLISLAASAPGSVEHRVKGTVGFVGVPSSDTPDTPTLLPAWVAPPSPTCL